MKKIILVLMLVSFIVLTGCTAEDKAPVTIRIASNPPGAFVYIDGNYKGETPLTVDKITRKTHRVIVEKAWYVAERSN